MGDRDLETNQPGSKPGCATGTLLTAVFLVWGVFVAVLFVIAYAFSEPDVEVLVEREVEIELSEFEISPAVIEVGPGTKLTFLINNVGDAQHNLQISDDVGTERIKPGESVVLEAGVVKRSFVYWCSIKGHRESGMEGRVELTSAVSDAAS